MATSIAVETGEAAAEALDKFIASLAPASPRVVVAVVARFGGDESLAVTLANTLARRPAFSQAPSSSVTASIVSPRLEASFDLQQRALYLLVRPARPRRTAWRSEGLQGSAAGTAVKSGAASGGCLWGPELLAEHATTALVLWVLAFAHVVVFAEYGRRLDLRLCRLLRLCHAARPSLMQQAGTHAQAQTRGQHQGHRTGTGTGAIKSGPPHVVPWCLFCFGVTPDTSSSLTAAGGSGVSKMDESLGESLSRQLRVLLPDSLVEYHSSPATAVYTASASAANTSTSSSSPGGRGPLLRMTRSRSCFTVSRVPGSGADPRAGVAAAAISLLVSPSEAFGAGVRSGYCSGFGEDMEPVCQAVGQHRQRCFDAFLQAQEDRTEEPVGPLGEEAWCKSALGCLSLIRTHPQSNTHDSGSAGSGSGSGTGTARGLEKGRKGPKGPKGHTGGLDVLERAIGVPADFMRASVNQAVPVALELYQSQVPELYGQDLHRRALDIASQHLLELLGLSSTPSHAYTPGNRPRSGEPQKSQLGQLGPHPRADAAVTGDGVMMGAEQLERRRGHGRGLVDVHGPPTTARTTAASRPKAEGPTRAPAPVPGSSSAAFRAEGPGRSGGTRRGGRDPGQTYETDPAVADGRGMCPVRWTASDRKLLGLCSSASSPGPPGPASYSQGQRGRDSQDPLRRLEAAALAYWDGGRRLCPARSLGGFPCSLRAHPPTCAHSAPASTARRGACICGRRRFLLPEPFTASAANASVLRPCCRSAGAQPLPALSARSVTAGSRALGDEEREEKSQEEEGKQSGRKERAGEAGPEEAEAVAPGWWLSRIGPFSAFDRSRGLVFDGIMTDYNQLYSVRFPRSSRTSASSPDLSLAVSATLTAAADRISKSQSTGSEAIRGDSGVDEAKRFRVSPDLRSADPVNPADGTRGPDQQDQRDPDDDADADGFSFGFDDLLASLGDDTVQAGHGMGGSTMEGKLGLGVGASDIDIGTATSGPGKMTTALEALGLTNPLHPVLQGGLGLPLATPGTTTGAQQEAAMAPMPGQAGMGRLVETGGMGGLARRGGTEEDQADVFMAFDYETPDGRRFLVPPDSTFITPTKFTSPGSWPAGGQPLHLLRPPLPTESPTASSTVSNTGSLRRVIIAVAPHCTDLVLYPQVLVPPSASRVSLSRGSRGADPGPQSDHAMGHTGSELEAPTDARPHAQEPVVSAARPKSLVPDGLYVLALPRALQFGCSDLSSRDGSGGYQSEEFTGPMSHGEGWTLAPGLVVHRPRA